LLFGGLIGMNMPGKVMAVTKTGLFLQKSGPKDKTT
jgi:hypothetical protein